VSLTPDTLRGRVTALRHAARRAHRENVAVKAAVDQRLAESRACLRESAVLLGRRGPQAVPPG
jgi:hypothetical protein